MTALVVAGMLGGHGCGDGGSESGNGDKAACQALADAKGEDAEIYVDLLKMNLSDEMRTALIDLRESTKRGDLQADTFEKAGKVAGLCAAQGVVLSG
ncbi:MAG: hypothetical protein ACRDX9_15260 [Acidimicrobiia bacterium]